MNEMVYLRGLLKRRHKRPRPKGWDRIYKKAYAAIDRCTNRRNPGYKHYGGRGIRVCDEWLDDCRLFAEYLLTLPGHRDRTLVLDRIDNDGNYEPGNLRFVTPKESVANRRRFPTGVQTNGGPRQGVQNPETDFGSADGLDPPECAPDGKSPSVIV
jgi:hypothetical protein